VREIAAEFPLVDESAEYGNGTPPQEGFKLGCAYTAGEDKGAADTDEQHLMTEYAEAMQRIVRDACGRSR